MNRKQISFRLSDEYILKLKEIMKQTGCSTQQELIMFLLDSYSITTKTNKQLSEELLIECQKQTSLLQMISYYVNLQRGK